MPTPCRTAETSVAILRTRYLSSSRLNLRPSTAKMGLHLLLLLALLAELLACRASADVLSLSLDGGETWRPLSEPVTSESLPEHVHLSTASEVTEPTLHLPRCAIEDALRVSVVREKRGGAVLGMRWARAKGCSGAWNGKEKGVVVAEEVAKRVKPDWVPFLKERGPDGGAEGKEGDGGKEKKENGFFGKYGLYIMGFVGIALAQGIKRGLAELREEMEREEADKLKERRPTGKVKVVVPKRKQSAKSRKKGGASSSAGK